MPPILQPIDVTLHSDKWKGEYRVHIKHTNREGAMMNGFYYLTYDINNEDMDMDIEGYGFDTIEKAVTHARFQLDEAFSQNKTLSSADTKLLYYLTRFLDIAEDHMPTYSSSDFIAEALDELKRIEDSIS